MAKTRVAPLKVTSVPLLAAVTASSNRSVKIRTQYEDMKIEVFWTDSSNSGIF